MTTLWILGVGGVGGYFGGKVAAGASPEHRICFFARGDHLEMIRKRGLILNTEEASGLVCAPSIATDDIRGLPPPDAVLLCVKSYSLAELLPSLAERMKRDTLILPLLNGIDVVERCRSILTQGVILPACVYVGTHIEAPGVVTQKGGEGKIVFGPDPTREADVSVLTNLFDETGVRFARVRDPHPYIWGKFVFIAPFGLVTAAHGKTLGAVMEESDLTQKVRDIMGEVKSLAAGKSVSLPGDIVESCLAKALEFPPETKTSFQRDFETPGKPNEADLFGGTILRLGRELGVDTPATQDVWNRLNSTRTLSRF